MHHYMVPLEISDESLQRHFFARLCGFAASRAERLCLSNQAIKRF
jgi:hypothetical protein